MRGRRVLGALVAAGCLGALAGLAGGRPSMAAPAWRWPLDGAPPVLRRFEPPATPYGPGHRGVDLAAAPGAAVRAAGPGVVSYAGTLAGRGVVAVRHADGLRTTYEPVAVAVRTGDRVVAGAQLGRVRGRHLGCLAIACLHWGLLRGRVYLDPLSLVGAGPVRLLPVGPDRGTSAPVPAGFADPVGGAVVVFGPPAWVLAPRRPGRRQPGFTRADAPGGRPA